MKTWRFIETESSPGFFNMAVDEALLDSYISQNTQPVLRFYRWSKPTLSLGKSQKKEEINFEECKNLGIDVVRRPTGGKAVFHESEFTYSFISGNKDGMPETILDSYLLISKALILGLSKLKNNFEFSAGEETSGNYHKNSFCFASSTVSDLNYLGNKFVGSAQLRRGDSFLQHGSILIDQDFEKLSKLFIHYPDNKSFANLCDILKFKPDYENIKNCILQGFNEFFSIELEKDFLSDYEKKLAESYFIKYDNNEFKGS